MAENPGKVGRIRAARDRGLLDDDAVTDAVTEAVIVPDTKDWTWVLREPCPECGYDATSVERGSFGSRIRHNAETWSAVRALSSTISMRRPARRLR